MRGLGKYNQLITFNTITESDDGQGGKTEATSANVSNVWAAVHTLRGQRSLDYQQLHKGVWYVIECKMNPNATIDVGSTITFGSKTLTVHEAYNIDESDWVLYIVAYAKQTTI